VNFFNVSHNLKKNIEKTGASLFFLIREACKKSLIFNFEIFQFEPFDFEKTQFENSIVLHKNGLYFFFPLSFPIREREKREREEKV
jgi:hypothetical protein